jgi:hypothetical protein
MDKQVNLAELGEVGTYPGVEEKAARELACAIHYAESRDCSVSWSAQERAQAFANTHDLAEVLDEMFRLRALALPPLKRYILVDPGERVRFDDDGEPATSGALGVIEEGNVYLTAYGKHLSGPKVSELAVGQRALVAYNLSGSKGTYEVLRVS